MNFQVVALPETEFQALGGLSDHELARRVPEVLRTRLLSVRAFDDNGIIIDADVVEGVAAAPVFERLLQNDKATYLHVHNAKRGCHAARVERPR